MNHETFINWLIDELWRDKPFNIKLDATEAESFHQITEGQFHVVDNVLLVDAGNADMIYHVLASYLSKMEVS